MENKRLLDILSRDDIKLTEIGMGDQFDGKTKTAVFCVIPDNDKTYNFVIGLFYTQLFQELYLTADSQDDCKLPIPVSFYFDEFANVALPDDFASNITTMRGRNISTVVIIQNLAQLKAIYKDLWENFTGNCDTIVYLGGNEQSTHEYLSKRLGKMTIYKTSRGVTRGRQGSSSNNVDVMERDVMKPDEVARLPRKKCIIILNGHFGVVDQKYYTPDHKRWKQCGDGGAKKFVYNKDHDKSLLDKGFYILTKKGLSYYEEQQKNGAHVYIDNINYDDFMLLGDKDLDKRFTEIDEKQEEKKARDNEEYVDVEETTDSNADDKSTERKNDTQDQADIEMLKNLIKQAKQKGEKKP